MLTPVHYFTICIYVGSECGHVRVEWVNYIPCGFSEQNGGNPK